MRNSHIVSDALEEAPSTRERDNRHQRAIYRSVAG
jgi:hypothetical protein